MRVLKVRARIARYLRAAVGRSLGSGVATDSRCNGEDRLLRSFGRLSSEGSRPATIFDVGGNVGSWSKNALKNVAEANLHIFEPQPLAFRVLERRFGTAEKVILNNCALGEAIGKTSLFFDSEGSGLASVYGRDLDHVGRSLDRQIEVPVHTIDAYCVDVGVGRVHYLKMDVEGHELAVLRGSHRMLSQGLIDVIQFEFGGCNIDSRTYFKDFWKLLHERYRIYRLARHGLLPIKTYSEPEEQFDYSNMVAINKDLAWPG